MAWSESLSASAATSAGGSATVATQTCSRRASTSHFHIMVRTFTRITERGQPCRMPLVARHHAPKHPATLKARRSCLYMAPTALATPGSMPSSNARAKTTAWGMRSKHLMNRCSSPPPPTPSGGTAPREPRSLWRHPGRSARGGNQRHTGAPKPLATGWPLPT